MTEDEKAIISDAEQILSDAIKTDQQQAREEAIRVFTETTEALWSHDPLSSTYDLWALRMAHTGTPETLADFRQLNAQFDPDAVVVKSSRSNDADPPNAALRLAHAFSAESGMPDNIVDLFRTIPAMLLIHEDAKDGPLVGLLCRTGAHATQKDDVRPSEDDEALDVVVTTMLLGGYIISQVRMEDGSEFPDNDIQVATVAKYNSSSDQDDVADCLSTIGEKHGRLYQALYSAFIMPKMMKAMDPDMYAAVLKDVLPSTDGEQPQNNKEK